MTRTMIALCCGVLSLLAAEASAGRRCGTATYTRMHAPAATHVVVHTATPAASIAVAKADTKDIVDTAVAAGNFNTLVAAVKAAGLVETLKGKGPFTVFAPTDEAFAKLPPGTIEALLKDKEKLKAVLTYHVVPGAVKAADVVKVSSAKSVQGSSIAIKVTEGKVKVDDANVVKADIECSNGIIHVIDAVILPK